MPFTSLFCLTNYFFYLLLSTLVCDVIFFLSACDLCLNFWLLVWFLLILWGNFQVTYLQAWPGVWDLPNISTLVLSLWLSCFYFTLFFVLIWGLNSVSLCFFNINPRCSVKPLNNIYLFTYKFIYSANIWYLLCSKFLKYNSGKKSMPSWGLFSTRGKYNKLTIIYQIVVSVLEKNKMGKWIGNIGVVSLFHLG